MARLHLDSPINAATTRYLNSLGLNPNHILQEGVNKRGYNEIAFDKDGTRVLRYGEPVVKRKSWPPGFVWSILVQCMMHDRIWPSGEYRP